MSASHVLRTYFLVVAVSSVGFATAEEPNVISDELRAQHFAKMSELAASIRLLADPLQDESLVKLVAKPLLRYSDDTRMTHESSVWIWSGDGRPSALLAIEYYPKGNEGPRWLYEIASLSAERIAARREPNLNWTATEPGLKLQPFQGVNSPSTSAVRRLIQMKEIQRHFTAYERASVEGRIELRPLSSPLFRYSDASAGILDGAIFAFVSGTNPEALLVLEAHTVQPGPSTWHYALVHLTGEPVVVELNGQEVWKQDEAYPPAVRNSYVNGYFPFEPQ